jgi:putative transcriptional regulator
MAKTFQSLKGQMLLDSGMLHGSFFHRSVVLICQHDADGAFGLVLSRASGTRIGDALPSNLPNSLQDQPLFLGGPVQPSALSYLIAGDDLKDPNVLPNLELGHSLDALIELADTQIVSKQIRVFAGYSGWSGGQLEAEMKRDAWICHPASLSWIFHDDPAHIWKMIMRQKNWQQRLIAESPEDPSWN